MNMGVEVVEIVLKFCCKWVYEVKKFFKDMVEIVVCWNNFYGCIIIIVFFFIDLDVYNNYGFFIFGFVVIFYNDVEVLVKVLDEYFYVVGFLVEFIQGEVGVYVFDEGYLKKCYDLCCVYNVFFIVDEVQIGIVCIGKLLVCDYENVYLDILILGKVLLGGVCFVFVVLLCNEVMDVICLG